MNQLHETSTMDGKEGDFFLDNKGSGRTVKSQRQQQKEQTRQRLIDTALSLYARQGLVATRTADVAREAGVSHGTVFAHFATQEALLNAVIEAFGTQTGARLHELASQGSSLREVLQAHLAGLREAEPFYARLVRENRLLPDESRHILTAVQSVVSHHLCAAAEREMQAGLIRNMPLHLLFNTWIGLLHYYLANDDLFAPEGPVLERYGEELLEHYLFLLAPRG
ncbi:TetR/AcrR family transcriptional regulator [Paenibacillus timonensis]|uniref:TetR/AcrR family transcriptional regulator n=1 Tax=Paenibacillus timonensis TaxID=225915 RepID=A0ABW3S8K0_9BACL|nr:MULTISPECIES: TetR/AcrR family transcriptional regulator [Paenibacillus]MCH1639809.1 TetR/AcrR family transcriptional regulator [Paenibacillus timonensis]MDU2242729.1 TetR/AcrR family transcriptional regulator [Paenibacillus sp.]